MVIRNPKILSSNPADGLSKTISDEWISITIFKKSHFPSVFHRSSIPDRVLQQTWPRVNLNTYIYFQCSLHGVKPLDSFIECRRFILFASVSGDLFTSVVLVSKNWCKRSSLVRLLMRRRTRLGTIFWRNLKDHKLAFFVNTSQFPIHFQSNISDGRPGRITSILTKNSPRKDDPKRTWWWSSLDAKWKNPLYLSLRICTKVGLTYTFCTWIYQFYSGIDGSLHKLCTYRGE